MISASSPSRFEHDSLGEMPLAADVYHGIQTQRALDNFQLSGVPISRYPALINALAILKKAAALANRDLRLLDAERANCIAQACDYILSGGLHAEFAVDLIQGGAGTSTNMNANEVIANRALELLGKPHGAYGIVHPNNDVNLSQSTNDVYPSALKLALRAMLTDLRLAVKHFADTCGIKAEEFRGVVKMGRTQLQDAVPMTLGQTFAAYRVTMLEEIERIDESRALLTELNLGGTAIGTGINTHPEYRPRVIVHLQAITNEPYCSAPDLVEATQDTGVFIQLSGVLKRTGAKLSKISSDLRLLSSGPRAGLNEINLPPMQPGSSIMPGKVNPVIPEAVNQVAFIVAGNDVTVTMAASAGQLELNAFEPVIAAKLFESIDLLARACNMLADKCVIGITANAEICRGQVRRSIGLVTALVPVIGYEKSAAIANEALLTGASVYDLALKSGTIGKEQLENLLDPSTMLAPNVHA